ncbi:MAG: hypothetical protein RR973_00270 [Anaerovoracaceae bacterium]
MSLIQNPVMEFLIAVLVSTVVLRLINWESIVKEEIEKHGAVTQKYYVWLCVIVPLCIILIFFGKDKLSSYIYIAGMGLAVSQAVYALIIQSKPSDTKND